MQPFQKADVSTQEWRWVAFFAGLFVILTLIPYAWAMVATEENWSFLGILIIPQDGATYFSKIRQGMNGSWLLDLHYTPETHEPAGLFTFYLMLGHVARLLSFSPVVIFHLTRLATSFFMFTALYQLGAKVWQRVRPRRLFFIIVSMGSGLGWMTITFVKADNLPPDLAVPEAFPLYAAYTNPHFPLSIGCLALLTSTILQVYRPGFDEAPTAENGGMAVIVYSIILAIVQPAALIGLGGALVVFILISGYRQREIPWHETRWAAMILLPIFPVILYYILVFQTNDVFAEFNEQTNTSAPNIFLTLIGYGVLLILAIPGIVRAVRRFERDGDQFMLLWLIVNAIVLYIPHSYQQSSFVGLVIPIVFFAVRSLEDYWFNRITRGWHWVALVMAFVLMIPSNIIGLGIPLYGAVVNPEGGADAAILIDQNYIEVYEWLEEIGRQNEVVLAGPNTSLWLPARTDLRVVYGHPFETVPAEKREQQMEDFFSGRDCTTLFDTKQVNFEITYVIYGPEEREITEEVRQDNPDETFRDCIVTLEDRFVIEPEQKREFGDVTLYTLRELR